MNRAAFYDAIRADINLTTRNVVGFEKHLDYVEAHAIALDKASYALATSSWETALTLHPVREYGSETYLRSKKYWPHVGMGLIQVTWRDNYIKAARLLGLPDTFFLDDPKRLLEWRYALPLLFKGMETGLYTGRKLDDYLDGVDESDAEDLREFSNARRIVNGTDKAVTIGKRALVFERGLKAAGYVPGAPVAAPVELPVEQRQPADGLTDEVDEERPPAPPGGGGKGKGAAIGGTVVAVGAGGAAIAADNDQFAGVILAVVIVAAIAVGAFFIIRRGRSAKKGK